MSCITKLLELKGDKEILPICDDVVIEGGGNYKDYEYLIVFIRNGHRCGYVAVKEHEATRFLEEIQNEDNYSSYPDLSCHGGVTFFDNSHRAKELLPFVCSDYWVGFDAAHCWDKKCLDTSKKYFPEALNRISELEKFYSEFPVFNTTHKSYEYIENECFNIIEQLIAQNVDHAKN